MILVKFAWYGSNGLSILKFQYGMVGFHNADLAKSSRELSIGFLV